MAPDEQFVIDFHHHIFNVFLVADEAIPRPIEGKRSNSAANDAKVSAISTGSTTDNFTAD